MPSRRRNGYLARRSAQILLDLGVGDEAQQDPPAVLLHEQELDAGAARRLVDPDDPAGGQKGGPVGHADGDRVDVVARQDGSARTSRSR